MVGGSEGGYGGGGGGEGSSSSSSSSASSSTPSSSYLVCASGGAGGASDDEDCWTKAARVPAMGVWSSDEQSDEFMRFNPPAAAVKKYRRPVHRYGPEEDMSDVYIATVPFLGVEADERTRRVIAVGCFSVAAFAVELHAAFMLRARSDALFISERTSSKFACKQGESGMRAPRPPADDKVYVSPAAMAIANNSVASDLVWSHLVRHNAVVKAIEDLAPLHRRDANEATRDKFRALKEKLRLEWARFRQAVVYFLRARHVAICRSGNLARKLQPSEPHPVFFDEGKRKHSQGIGNDGDNVPGVSGRLSALLARHDELCRGSDAEDVLSRGVSALDIA